MSIPTVLIDTSVVSLGKSDPAHWTRKDPKPNDFTTNKYFGYAIKQMTESDIEIFKINMAIGNEARKQSFLFYTSQELWVESIVGYQSMSNNHSPLYAFRGVTLNSLQSPIVRTRLFPSSNFVNKEEIEAFMDFLLNNTPIYLNEIVNAVDGVSDFERECVKKISIFQHLCSNSMFGRKMARDVYHLWTGECHGLNYFLTLDLKFLNVYSSLIKQSKLNLGCRVVSPQEFSKEFRISTDGIELPPSGKIFFAHGAEIK